MISVKNIRIPRNWVLVKPDPDYESFQIKGKETGIIAPSHVYENGKRYKTESKNYSVTGTVYGVPETLTFNREKIKSIYQNQTVVNKDKHGQAHIVDSVLLRRINQLKRLSCRFETENELHIGDRVKFSYFVHISVKENKGVFETEEGKMYFIKYDDIYMTLDEEGNANKMINGYLLVDPQTVETEKEGGLEYEQAGGGIVIPKMNEQSKQKRGIKCMEGVVKKVGNPLMVDGRMGGYFDLDETYETDMKVDEGDKILFDPRTALQLEHENHQSMSDHLMYLIQRKDILFKESENKGFNEIGLEKLN